MLLVKILSIREIQLDPLLLSIHIHKVTQGSSNCNSLLNTNHEIHENWYITKSVEFTVCEMPEFPLTADMSSVGSYQIRLSVMLLKLLFFR